jgi:A/G-specific adenine glycosylase
MERKTVIRLWCVHNEKLLLHHSATSARRLGGLHELPTAAQAGLADAAAIRLQKLATKRRSITRFQITESIHAFAPGAVRRRGLMTANGLVWVPLAKLNGITLSGPHRRWITQLLARG